MPPAHSPTLAAGACGASTLARELASLDPPPSSPPTHALAALPSFTLPPSALQGYRKDLASTSLDNTPIARTWSWPLQISSPNLEILM